jgi:ubiquitin thioesterase OTU1
MRIRVRGPNGQATITLDDTASWADLSKEIRSKAGVTDFDLKYGYPPQPFNTESIDGGVKLSDLPVKLNGEQLVVVPRDVQAELSKPMAGTKPPSEAVKPLSPLNSTSAPQQKTGDFPGQQPSSSGRPTQARPKPKPKGIEAEPPEIPVPQLEGTMVLRVMPDDNSCMFRAVSSAVLGSAIDGMTELRSIVAQKIQADPEFYNEGILGMPRETYCRKIQQEDTWGGYIELHALSQHFEMEFVSIDVQTLRRDKYNEGKEKRCILVYSGIHYDVLAVTPYVGADPEMDRKVFDVLHLGEDEEEDGGALDAALRLCKELQQRHYFTDTAGFDVECNTCGQGGNGERWAMQHAQATGHTNFGEGEG